jgi:hypothetical protein
VKREFPFKAQVKEGQRQLWCNGCLLYHVVRWNNGEPSTRCRFMGKDVNLKLQVIK